MFFYILNVDNYYPNAKYIIQAEVAGQKSNRSEGHVTFNLSPYKPFTVTEAS